MKVLSPKTRFFKLEIFVLILVVSSVSFQGQQVESERQLVPAPSLICVPCGPHTPRGTRDINCSSITDFECTSIADDLGNEVKVACIDKAFYACLYIPQGGKQRFVGLCPYFGGRNTVSLYVIPDQNCNGKIDRILGTVWISRDGPSPWEGYNDDDDDGKFDRWMYIYSALADKVKQDRLDCDSYYSDSCLQTKSETKKPKEDCFEVTDLQPNPPEDDGDSIMDSTLLAFPDHAVVRGNFTLRMAHEEIVVRAGEQMDLSEFLERLYRQFKVNRNLGKNLHLIPQLLPNGQPTIRIQCIDPQEIAIMEADQSLEFLPPVTHLQATCDPHSGRVHLTWAPGTKYDMVVIWRNGNRISDYYSGKTNAFTDDFKSSPLDLLEQKKAGGSYTYTVFGIQNGVHSIAQEVTVNVVSEKNSSFTPGFRLALGLDWPGDLIKP
ncbi:MAG: hypothetical protein ACM3SY_21270 [Candidatus Omnitrophota bacterium]